MRMSTRGRYGLRIMIELALRHGQGPVPVDSISVRQVISANYVHLLAGGLKTMGLLRSVRGAGGGYELARDPAEITALEVVNAIEGSTPVECVTRPTSCERSGNCVARELWCDVCLAMDQVLGSHTLEALAARQRAMDEELPELGGVASRGR